MKQPYYEQITGRLIPVNILSFENGFFTLEAKETGHGYRKGETFGSTRRHVVYKSPKKGPHIMVTELTDSDIFQHLQAGE